jgi:hypothetical protein
MKDYRLWRRCVITLARYLVVLYVVVNGPRNMLSVFKATRCYNHANSQTMNTVGAAASNKGAFMYIHLYTRMMLLYIYCVYVYA